MKSLPGAIARFKQVMDEYPDFAANDKLFYYTGLTYAAMMDYDSALSFFQRAGRQPCQVQVCQESAAPDQQDQPSGGEKQKSRARC